MEKRTRLSTYEKRAQEHIIYLIDTFCDGNQQRFVERTGLNKASVSQYVNGKNTPSNINADKIGAAFNVNPVWVMGFDESMDIQPEDADSMKLTHSEKEIIRAYRRASDDIQVAVCAVLGVKKGTESTRGESIAE